MLFRIERQACCDDGVIALALAWALPSPLTTSGDVNDCCTRKLTVCMPAARFGAEARVEGTYMFCRQDSVLQAARHLSRVDGLSLQARLAFCSYALCCLMQHTCMAAAVACKASSEVSGSNWPAKLRGIIVVTVCLWPLFSFGCLFEIPGARHAPFSFDPLQHSAWQGRNGPCAHNRPVEHAASPLRAWVLMAHMRGVQQERFWFCMAPCNLRSPVGAAALLRFAERYAARQPVPADVQFRDGVPRTSDELCDLEAAHQVRLVWLCAGMHGRRCPVLSCALARLKLWLWCGVGAELACTRGAAACMLC